MKASNIVNCSRINLASKAFPSQNDNITHHATVPLKSGQEQFGILNVASPNTEIYSDEDLELLESVAFQLGSAIKRIYLTSEGPLNHCVLLDSPKTIEEKLGLCPSLF